MTYELVWCKTKRYAPAQHPRAPALSQRMSLGDYRGSQPASRVKQLDNGDLEDGLAGESDGRSADEITVGWGGLVRRAFPTSRIVSPPGSLHGVHAGSSS